jgi:hypothetical protein
VTFRIRRRQTPCCVDRRCGRTEPDPWQQIDLSGRVVVFESLKKRRKGVFRAVPVPPELLDALDLVHGIRETQRRGQAGSVALTCQATGCSSS